ncbi:class I SAM-dependent methyltransferase [Tenggerimyces flavus]|uniref:Class I SAM-dependent methyltransferase n=1 Tax=Tenggerimyces flavus TaxID=1708749 RepID=A0ABV7YEW1_9ACTN|nr:class I SAM-dependent methyltransferase [Tenggerimyces flavus]MBM7783394.1 SAM-dependent methyltransferase [Tenggerimyces flavus]
MSWQWDPTLYEGSAEYYAVGRMPYPQAIADAIRDALDLDGTGGYLDIGCGPGSLTTLVAPLFERATGVDADQGMIRVAKANAPEIDWRCMRAEELPADLGDQRLITFAQSFHWFDRPLVAGIVRGMLQPGGAVVHVGATTHEGIEGSTTPRDEIRGLITEYLGSTRRAGQGVLTDGTAGGENAIFAAAGFDGPQVVEVERGELLERSEDQIVASVFSLSGAAPHLFGDRREAFERDLRQLLRDHSPEGTFVERARGITLSVWR